MIAAIAVIGRSGSAFAAEIGTMRVIEELDALQSIALDPVAFLRSPGNSTSFCLHGGEPHGCASATFTTFANFNNLLPQLARTRTSSQCGWQQFSGQNPGHLVYQLCTRSGVAAPEML